VNTAPVSVYFIVVVATTHPKIDIKINSGGVLRRGVSSFKLYQKKQSLYLLFKPKRLFQNNLLNKFQKFFGCRLRGALEPAARAAPFTKKAAFFAAF
jgi:hypothetical protein